MTDHSPVPERRVDIAVCTFRRKELEQTLVSLALMRRPEGVHLRAVVADNDVTPSAAPRVEAARRLIGMEIVYVHAPAGNISIARNACLDHCAADFVAFIDDDETVDELWLVTLLEQADQTGAAAVLGPVKAHYRPDAPGWMRRGDFHSTRPVWVDGAIRTGYTCNVLLRLDSGAIAGRRFDLALGRSGGEDTAFFDAVHAAGGRIEFAAEAWVHEPVAKDRATFLWLARRRFRMGQTHGRILADKYEGFSRLRQMGLAATKCGFCAAVSLALFPFRVRRYRYALRGALHAGAVAGLFGARAIEQYGQLENAA
ncbi:glycosyltransferase [Rhizobium sp. TRM95111]|uniref:glycosyltransferase n=1 Tax=Rhizobium alarense TaxID=2846851 RepID=UPI001F3D84F1|nr:glycosyltransferase [Rhizobium alarense]MCF3638938.1 glycosyltransferase [Rhizobium alarense]